MEYRIRTYMRGNVFPKDWEVVEKLQLYEAISIGEFDPNCKPGSFQLSPTSEEYWHKVRELLRDFYSGDEYKEIPAQTIEEFINTVLAFPDRYVSIERK